MIVYCIEDFKIAYEKLLAKNSYKTLAEEIEHDEHVTHLYDHK